MLRMGLCLGTEVTEEKKARIHSAKIDRDLYEYAKREMNVVKILLLGETDQELTWMFCTWGLAHALYSIRTAPVSQLAV